MSYIYVLSFFFSFPLWAAFSPHSVFPAFQGKHHRYIGEGIIRGGNPRAVSIKLSHLRWGLRDGFERMVIDLEGTEVAWEGKVPPYFQVGVGKEKIHVGVHNVQKVLFSQKEVERTFRSSRLVNSVYIAPLLEGRLALLGIKVKKAVDVEAFYLVYPPRIILDMRAKKTIP